MRKVVAIVVVHCKGKWRRQRMFFKCHIQTVVVAAIVVKAVKVALK